MLVPAVNSGDHVLGQRRAGSVELVEYGSYDCPECYRAFIVVKDIQRYLGNQLVYVFRQFPACDERSISFRAAEAAEAAAAQGWFWEMHDLLFENQWQLDDSHLALYAASLPLDADLYRRELTNRTFAPIIRESLKSAVLSGVRRCPTFFINGQIYNGKPEIGELLCRIEDIGSFSENN